MGIEQPITVRRLLSDDAVDFGLLQLMASADDAFASRPETAERVHSAHYGQLLSESARENYWGAFCGEALIGMVGFGVRTDRCTGTLFGLFVDQAYRACGTGQRLVHALLQDRVALVDQIGLFAAEGSAAIRLYEKLGFKRVTISGVDTPTPQVAMIRPRPPAAPDRV